VNEKYPEIKINLLAVKENYRTICRLLVGGPIVSAMVKNDAYGLGAQRISCSLYEAGCRDFWVAYIQEALDIRNVLPPDANVYYLQGFCHTDLELLPANNIVPVINSLPEFNVVKNKGLRFVLHVDTGLTRLGMRRRDLDAILPNLAQEQILYVISHLANEYGGQHDWQQKRNFDEILAKILNVTCVKESLTASNVLNLDESFHYDLVRVGAFLYGIQGGGIRPLNVLTIKAKILQMYDVPKGTCIGYGATHVTDRKTKVAIISIGYGDGIKRQLSNVGNVLFYDSNKNLYKARILGNISMDSMACDITDVSSGVAVEGADAILIDDTYTINDMANAAQTIPYEILTSINFKSKRIKLTYVE
jgi:alanine racemase